MKEEMEKRHEQELASLKKDSNNKEQKDNSTQSIVGGQPKSKAKSKPSRAQKRRVWNFILFFQYFQNVLFNICTYNIKIRKKFVYKSKKKKKNC